MRFIHLIHHLPKTTAYILCVQIYDENWIYFQFFGLLFVFSSVFCFYSLVLSSQMQQIKCTATMNWRLRRWWWQEEKKQKKSNKDIVYCRFFVICSRVANRIELNQLQHRIHSELYIILRPNAVVRLTNTPNIDCIHIQSHVQTHWCIYL